MGAFQAIRMVLILAVVLIVAGGLYYVTGLRADLATSQANEQKLQDGINMQAALLEQMKQDMAQQQQINRDLEAVATRAAADVKNLEGKFRQNAAGEARDFGALAAARPESAERAVNRGTVRALRCFEIATGSNLTEEEKNAKTPREANSECPSLVDPNFRSHTP